MQIGRNDQLAEVIYSFAPSDFAPGGGRTSVVLLDGDVPTFWSRIEPVDAGYAALGARRKRYSGSYVPIPWLLLERPPKYPNRIVIREPLLELRTRLVQFDPTDGSTGGKALTYYRGGAITPTENLKSIAEFGVRYYEPTSNYFAITPHPTKRGRFDVHGHDGVIASSTTFPASLRIAIASITSAST